MLDPRRGVTSVFGTASPLRGASGALRRLAYRIPTYKTERWMLLVLADRIDVIEHNPARLAIVLGGLGAIAGFLGWRALRAR